MIECSLLEQSMSSLEKNEYAVIQEISRRPTHTQRSLSESIGLSLGTTNVLIQRLARKGLIKVNQLDWKRTQYLLTPKGASEKTRKAYDYALYTLKLFKQLNENVATVVRREHAAGRRAFCVVAQDEMMDLVRDCVSDLNLPDARFTCVRAFGEATGCDLILAASLEPKPKDLAARVVDVVDFDNIAFRIEA